MKYLSIKYAIILGLTLVLVSPLQAQKPLDASSIANLVGDWDFVANGFAGILEIRYSGSTLQGRVNYKKNNKWEPLEDLKYNPSTNQFSFYRPNGKQLHEGVLDGSDMKGTFSGIWKWTATKTGQTPTHKQSTPVDASSAEILAGTWDLVANGYAGKIEITNTGSSLQGRIYFNTYQKWEPLEDLKFNPSTKQFSFYRPNAKQQHEGILNGLTLTGTFNKTSKWTATKIGQTQTPNQSAPVDAASAEILAGTWDLVANGYAGKIEITNTGSSLQGRIYFNTYQKWEPLEDLKFNPSTKQFTFYRPNAKQQHEGILNGLTLTGTFNKTSKWTATKIGQSQVNPSSQESIKSSGEESASNNPKKGIVKLNVNLENTNAVAGDLTQNSIQLIISEGTFDQKVNLQVKEGASASQFDNQRATLIGTPFDITIDQESKRLHKPVIIKAKLDQKEIAALKRPIDLCIGYFNGKTWDYFPPLEVNLKEKYVKFETYHFSEHAKAELAKAEQINSFSYQNAVSKWAEKDNGLLTKQATQQMVKQILIKNMGINNKSLTQDIVEAIMKENDYTKLLVSYNDNKMDEFGTDLAVLAGKKILDVVSKESNAKALLGAVTEHSSKIGAGINIGIALAEGDLTKAAKELSLEIINTYPVTKLFKAAAEVTERQVNRWRDNELEAAYQVFVHGANSRVPFWGYQVDPGNFNQVWSQMRGLENKLQDDALKNYAAIKNIDISQLGDAMIQTIRNQTKEDFRKEFTNRKQQESKIAVLKAENLKLINEFESANLLTQYRFGFSDETSFQLRLVRLFRIKEMILQDTKSRLGFSGLNQGGVISAKTVAGLIQLWYSENGKEKYRKELIRLGYLKEEVKPKENDKNEKPIQPTSSTENWKVASDNSGSWSATAKRKILEKTAQCTESFLDMKITAKISSSSSTLKSGEIDKQLRSWMSESASYPEEGSIAPITISGFKGKLLTTKLKYTNGFGSPMAGYKAGRAIISGYAILLSDDGLQTLKVSYYSSAACCWDNKGAETSKKEAMAGNSAAENLMRSLTISGTKINASVSGGSPNNLKQ